MAASTTMIIRLVGMRAAHNMIITLIITISISNGITICFRLFRRTFIVIMNTYSAPRRRLTRSTRSITTSCNISTHSTR